MTDLVEKHYSVDAGIGKKMEGCPYSIFEDGHDVQDFILAPKGYVFSKFIFEPYAGNQVYDGKLTAQYEKEPLKERMTTILQVLIWVLIAAVIIGIIIFLTVGIFKPKKSQSLENKPETETPTFVSDSLSISEAETETPKDTTTFVEQTTENQDTTTLIEEQAPIVETQEPITTQPVVVDDNVKFKEEFWTLIHQRAIQMDDYDGLYKQYKGNVSGEEYDYLRFTILKDSPSYLEWSRKLRKIPASEITSIETVDALKNKLKEIN